MSISVERVQHDIVQSTTELFAHCNWHTPKLVVIGCSTSEVIGHHIGSAGSLDIAKAIFDGLTEVSAQYPFVPAFQCCEHLNRALVMEEEVAERYGYTIVHAVPHSKAGGAMATYAYHQLKQPVLVEHIQASAGIDIGNTLIGMHLKHVAVPFRSSVKQIGNAHLTMAYTRPKLIGGERAQYK
jgi:uncharacterized protein (TIGR01440 family)